MKSLLSKELKNIKCCIAYVLSLNSDQNRRSKNERLHQSSRNDSNMEVAILN